MMLREEGGERKANQERKRKLEERKQSEREKGIEVREKTQWEEMQKQ